jgi:hypothetical protein
MALGPSSAVPPGALPPRRSGATVFSVPQGETAPKDWRPSLPIAHVARLSNETKSGTWAVLPFGGPVSTEKENETPSCSNLNRSPKEKPRRLQAGQVWELETRGATEKPRHLTRNTGTLTKSFDKSADAADRPGAERQPNQPKVLTSQSFEAVLGGEGNHPAGGPAELSVRL